MSEPDTLSRVIQGELPFTLNLPGGRYEVKLGDDTYPIELHQAWFLVANDATSFVIGPADDLRNRLGERWESSYKHELRTVVRRRDVVQIPADQLIQPTDDQV